MINIKQIGNGLRGLFKVDLDWKAYFQSFCERHGGFPVKHKGVLLFRDGWRYSATDYKGPEFAPPTDAKEHMLLRRSYWSIRQVGLRQQEHELKKLLQIVTGAASAKSAPLQHKVLWEDDEGQKVLKTVDLDLSVIEQRLDFLEQDILECVQHLETLNEVTYV